MSETAAIMSETTAIIVSIVGSAVTVVGVTIATARILITSISRELGATNKGLKYAVPPEPRAAVEQDRVVDWSPPLRAVVTRRSLPDDLVLESVASENGVAQDAQVRVRGWVAVDVDRSLWLQHPPQLEQPHGHHDEVALHARAVHDSGVVDRRVDLWLALGDLAVPREVDVAQRPGV